MKAEVQIHVLNLRVEAWRAFDDILTPDEIARRDRFIREPDRQAFTICRAGLRERLGTALSIPARELRFVEGPYGKPHLVDGTLAFNVSHSKDLGLIAITPLPQVGVDIEYMRALTDLFDLARRYFSPREQALLHTLPESLHVEGFFNAWSRKEAFIKAIGRGLSFPLDRFDVSLDPRVPAELLTLRGTEYTEREWALKALTIAPDYRAAVVTPMPATVSLYPLGADGVPTCVG